MTMSTTIIFNHSTFHWWCCLCLTMMDTKFACRLNAIQRKSEREQKIVVGIIILLFFLFSLLASLSVVVVVVVFCSTILRFSVIHSIDSIQCVVFIRPHQFSIFWFYLFLVYSITHCCCYKSIIIQSHPTYFTSHSLL